MLETLVKMKGFKGTKDMLQRLYVKEGKSIEAIAAEIGCGYSTIRRQMTQFKIKAKRRGGRSLTDDIAREDLTKLTLQEIVDKYPGVSLSAAFRARKRLKIT